ncbi:MAG TPA: ribosome maturation factor RimM [Acidimicrobiia bacterium]|nr:ribosome maturation factor RimM [Acidimicrobiia bacterium]
MIGRLGRPHGLDGYLGLYVDEEDAVSVQPGMTVFLDGVPHLVRAIRRVDRGFQVIFEGIESREAAEEVRGLEVAVPERRPLGDDEFWPADLIGLPVFEPDGREVGVVIDVVLGPGQDRLRVKKSDDVTFEIPFVDALVPLVDLASGRIEVDLIPGLIEP